ncbi:hypothetical protein NDU88_006087 [Pleurodeles waltl]|uniref:Uncharacterized protein n=1 Tax=Pleurodeles waltl TaxID=8319 RepID=A0AAV7RNX9_PLEWA|nr:hypothetical protein NDU88_006087 [Pleurodeles waltl]
MRSEISRINQSPPVSGVPRPTHLVQPSFTCHHTDCTGIPQPDSRNLELRSSSTYTVWQQPRLQCICSQLGDTESPACEVQPQATGSTSVCASGPSGIASPKQQGHAHLPCSRARLQGQGELHSTPWPKRHARVAPSSSRHARTRPAPVCDPGGPALDPEQALLPSRLRSAPTAKRAPREQARSPPRITAAGLKPSRPGQQDPTGETPWPPAHLGPPAASPASPPRPKRVSQASRPTSLLRAYSPPPVASGSRRGGSQSLQSHQDPLLPNPGYRRPLPRINSEIRPPTQQSLTQ